MTTDTLREISKRLIQEGDDFKKIADRDANNSTGASYLTLALAMKTVATAILEAIEAEKPEELPSIESMRGIFKQKEGIETKGV